MARVGNRMEGMGGAVSSALIAGVALLWSLNIADGVLTLILLPISGAHELNPLVASLATHHAMGWFWLIKGAWGLAATAFVLPAAYHRYETVAWRFLLAMIAIFSLVVVLNLTQLMVAR